MEWPSGETQVIKVFCSPINDLLLGKCMIGLLLHLRALNVAGIMAAACAAAWLCMAAACARADPPKCSEVAPFSYLAARVRERMQERRFAPPYSYIVAWQWRNRVAAENLHQQLKFPLNTRGFVAILDQPKRTRTSTTIQDSYKMYALRTSWARCLEDVLLSCLKLSSCSDG